MRNKKSLKLVDIVRGKVFTRELSRAAAISHEIQGEAYFLVYLTEGNQVKINEAIAGTKELNPLNTSIPVEKLTEDHYDFISPTSTNPEYKHEQGKGSYIEAHGCRLIGVHFHPPKGLAIPSSYDFEEFNESRRQNDNMVELCNSNDDEFIEYVNPIGIVGHVIGNNPNSYELFVCQEKPNKPIAFHDDFMRRVAKQLNEKSGKDTPPEVHFMCGFGNYFGDVKKFTQFIDDMGLHTTGLFKVMKQDYSDLDRMSMFQPKLVRREY